MDSEHVVGQQVPTQRRRAIGPIGTLARVCTAAGMGALAYTGGVQWYELALGFVVLPVAVMIVVIASQRVLGTSAHLRATGTYGTILNFGMIFALFQAMPEVAAIFYGVPMLLAAWRGYAGCEVLAISNFLLGRDDKLGCPWFIWVDLPEASLLRRSPAES